MIDGSKGLWKVVQEVFGDRALVQRCKWHKRENVLSYPPKSTQGSLRRKLQETYGESTYEKAKEKLFKIRQKLHLMNRSAVNS